MNGAIWAGVQFSSPPSSGGGGDGSGCTWRLAKPYDSGIGEDEGPVEREVDGILYRLFERSCGGSSTYIWIPAPTPGQLAQQASSALISQLPRPVPRTAPPGPQGVVNVGMWFWTDRSVWGSRSVTAWVPTPSGVLWATTTATPTGLVFASGTGGWASCAGPGAVWTPSAGDGRWSSCSYTYSRSTGGAVAASLGIQWSVTWSSNTGAGGSLGTHVTSSGLSVAVEEIQALVTT